MKFISPCLWFDSQAEEAVKFYTSIFKNSKVGATARYGKSAAEASGQEEGSVMTVEFHIEDADMVALNAGPMFHFSPALSFFVQCSSEEELRSKWSKLSEGGHARFELTKYPWSDLYGWVTDKFGVDWQLILGKGETKISPSFLFTNKLYGKGAEAIHFYTSIFPNSKVESMSKDEKTNTVMHSAFSLNGQSMILMEGPGKDAQDFTHATSLMVTCKDQKEIDYYWEKLTEGGSEEPCGWLKDKYGVSWQIIPEQLEEYAADNSKSDKIFAVMVQMKKLDVAKLLEAARS